MSARSTASPADLWREHDALLALRRPSGFLDISPALLEVKEQLALTLASPCRLCARQCGVDRPAGARGWCGVGWPGRIGEEHIHFGELEELIPTHSIFFSGCTMGCVYCRKQELINEPDAGMPFEPETFAATVQARVRQGARSLKLLGGTPEPQLPAVLRLLRSLPERLPVALETTMYIPPEVVRLYEGAIDLLICNVRYGEETCAVRLSHAPGYVRLSRRALEQAAGRLRVSLRHLVLPGHIDCCTAGVARSLQELFPDEPLMLLTQYTPFGAAMRDPVLGRNLTAADRDKALAVAKANKDLVELWPID